MGTQCSWDQNITAENGRGGLKLEITSDSRKLGDLKRQVIDSLIHIFISTCNGKTQDLARWQQGWCQAPQMGEMELEMTTLSGFAISFSLSFPSCPCANQIQLVSERCSLFCR